MPDADGKLWRKEAIGGVNARGEATVSYRYKNPVSGAVENKVTYCKKTADLAICAGFMNPPSNDPNVAKTSVRSSEKKSSLPDSSSTTERRYRGCPRVIGGSTDHQLINQEEYIELT